MERVGQTTEPYEASWESLKELHCLEDLGVYLLIYSMVKSPS